MRVVMHSDVKALGPTWSGAYITRNHAYISPDGADWAMVFGVRDGQITSFRVVEDTAKVAAAFR